MRPVLLKHGPTKRVNLYLPLDLKSGSLKPKVKASDAGKQRTHRQTFHDVCTTPARLHRPP
jgi:hypothetical protein